GGTAKVTQLEDHLGDVLEYSTLIDKGGGTFDETKRLLSWPDVNLQPKEKQSRTFAVQLLATTPSTPVGQSDPSSYNCLMENVFGNDYTIPVTCAPPKVIEKVTTELPKTGPTENMIFAGVVLAVVTYFFFRSKQMNKEVRLIRRDLNAGTI
ncbi:MAG: LPXTG cell wall anchor domain-containing protein, partial [Candidatus Microsaccharimonas sp.]